MIYFSFFSYLVVFGSLFYALITQSWLFVVISIICATLFLVFERGVWLYYVALLIPVFLISLFLQSFVYALLLFVFLTLVIYWYREFDKPNFFWHIPAFFWIVALVFAIVLKGGNIFLLAGIFFVTLFIFAMLELGAKENLLGSLILVELTPVFYFLTSSIPAFILMLFGCYYFIVYYFKSGSMFRMGLGASCIALGVLLSLV